ncbi:leucyl aminopeptidase [Candidatus Mesenet endosymbiont of Agriotes lineatus]|uniref:leucyl aminopeptidase n=1 Tax=Candidatus Mesenet endosymbiont of Agriotes lineatus TaxID=3077948 RepID=UPI0030CF7D22
MLEVVFTAYNIGSFLKAAVVVIGLFEGFSDIGSLKEHEEQVLSYIKNFGNFTGKFGEFLPITLQNKDNNDQLILVIGFGKKDEWDENKALSSGGIIYSKLKELQLKQAAILIDGNEPNLSTNIAYGASLRSFKFDKYITKVKEETIDPEKITLLVSENHLKDVQNLYNDLIEEGQGIFLARSLVSEPPNTLYPESYAQEIKKELSKLDLDVEILNESDMRKKGMGALLGVGQGSEKESRLVVIKWDGGPKNQKPIALVGKGITFDTGGISLKPARGMWEMKYDMAGSAAVVGIMRTLAGRKAKVNAIGVVALAENAIGGNAQRPSDIVTSMSGQTIEVLNTDAEGRLVLADALWYTQKMFAPQVMINLATLTGAIVVALGNNQYAGLFSNNEELANNLLNAGNESGEKLWQFPLSEEYNKMIDSPVADMQNIVTVGSGADSITAAQFLQRFVYNTAWAHLDIAGTAWNKEGTYICPKGATGFGVRLLNRLVAKYYEN